MGKTNISIAHYKVMVPLAPSQPRHWSSWQNRAVWLVESLRPSIPPCLHHLISCHYICLLSPRASMPFLLRTKINFSCQTWSLICLSLNLQRFGFQQKGLVANTNTATFGQKKISYPHSNILLCIVLFQRIPKRPWVNRSNNFYSFKYRFHLGTAGLGHNSWIDLQSWEKRHFFDDNGGYHNGNQKTAYHTGDDHDHEDGDGDGDGSKQLEDNLQHWWFNGQGSFLQERGRGGGGRGSKEHPGPANY